MAITAASWWTQADSGLDHRASGAVILAFACFKAWLVALNFMELRHGPAALRHTVGALLAGVCLGLVALLLWL